MSKVKLSECFEAPVAGEWGSEPLGAESDITVLRAADFTKDCKLTFGNSVKRAIEHKKLSKKMLHRGDVVVEKSGGSPTQPVGRVVYFSEDKRCTFSNFLALLRPKHSYCSKYLYYYLVHNYETRLVLRYQQQTTGIINFQLNEYLTERIEIASLSEQSKIAEILSTVDQVIELTDKEISKLVDLKKGMMNDLFTKGIGHSKFKDSPIGKIPEEWTVQLIKDVFSIGHGFAFESIYFRDSYFVYALLTPAHFHEEGGFRDLGTKQKYYEGPVSSDYVLGRNEIIVVMTEQAEGLLGSPALIPADGKYLHNQRLGRLKFDHAIIENEFAFFLFCSQGLRKQIAISGEGTKVRHTSPEKIGKCRFALPPVIEQKKIALVLNQQNDLIKRKYEYRDHLLKLKKALMNDLFTGKVKVKV